MEKFKNTYRIASARLQNWDYGWNASYFVTLCCKNRECFFGNVAHGKMVLNPIGMVARDCWLLIPDHFPFVKLGNHIIMPNHLHGILIIDKPDGGRKDHPNVETQNIASLPDAKNHFGPQSQNLASIVRGFKIGVTKKVRKTCPHFNWQSRYYDHIIRNARSFEKIDQYITNNPLNWEKDKFHSTY